MPSKGVDGSCASRNLTTMRDSMRYRVFVSCPKRNSLVIEKQSVAALNADHILVEIVNMLRGDGIFSAGPECHLSPINSVEHIALYSWSCLIGSSNLVGAFLHETRKFLHISNSHISASSEARIPAFEVEI
jgi:hypothetical protein